MEFNKTNKWTQEEVAAFVEQYSDKLIRYAFCIVPDANACEQLVLDSISSFVFRNADRALSKAYLYRMVRSRCIDYLRLHRRFVPLGDVEQVLAAPDTAESRAMESDRYETLYRCLDKLAVDYRNVLYLHFLEGFSVEETCRILRKNAKQVYNLISRAKIALKQALSEEGFDDEDL